MAGWKPRLAAPPEQAAKTVRPWVAIAEEAAPTAVKLFVSIMNNTRYPVKVRMEAATRLVMIAGATFRGEKLDGQGRPAANLPGVNVTRLESSALKEVLRQLPPGSASMSPSAVNEGEKVVVMHDGIHSQKPTGHILQAVVGKLIEKDSPATVSPEDRQEAVEDYIDKRGGPAKPTPVPLPLGPAISMLESVWKK